MNIAIAPPLCGSFRLALEFLRLIAALLALAAVLPAQPTPAALNTVAQPAYGPAFFDTAGNVYYLSGPVTPGAAQTQSGGGTCYIATGIIGDIPETCPDAQVVKVDSTGAIVYGTLLGGATADSAVALAVNPAGEVFVTGSTLGSFPTTSGAAVPTSTTARAFAARLNAAGSSFLYSTYLPDTAATATAIAIDAQNNAYITGKSSAGLPYIVKINPAGSAILYNVSLAGGGVGSANALTVDAAGNAIVAGQTSAADFPVTAAALQSTLKGAQNLFLAKFDPTGQIVFATYLGGSGSDSPAVVQTDSAGNIYVAGATSSLDFPTTQGTVQPEPLVPAWNTTSPAGFAVKVDPSGSALLWGAYVMSADNVAAPTFYFSPPPIPQTGVGEMAVTPSGDVYLGGLTGSGFPVTPSAPQICFSGTMNRTVGFLAHLDPQGALADATYLAGGNGADVDYVWGIAPAAGGSIRVVWHNSGNDVLSQVQFGSGGWTAAPCLSASVLNAATQSAQFGIAAGELITLTGFGIGPDAGVAYQPDAQGLIPRQLAGVQVLIDGTPAPVLYAQSRQINAAVPVELAGVAFTSVSVLYNGQQFGPVSAPLTFGSPGIFRLQPGLSSQAIAVNEDQTLNSPANPAARGSVVAIWTTGYGPTNPACTTGGLNIDRPTGLLSIGAEIFYGGISTALYAGSAPELVCGVVQVNFRVPDSIAPGQFVFFPWVQWYQPTATITNELSVGATIAVK
jgi:uncharacterized protein (TIGR03437 family)